MPSIALHIQPVYSALHPDKTIGGMQLLRHQVETLDAFNDAEVDVIFNTAMTGDGKSLAAYLPALHAGQSVVAMYPSNELVRDQYTALPLYGQRLHLRLPKSDTMYSNKITQLTRLHEATRIEEIRKLIENNPILLTNPDIIHLIMGYHYGWGHLKQELAVTTAMSFDYFLFDEFHVFGVPQVLAVTNMLGYLATSYANKPNERKKFVFLSATPTPLLTQLLERSGLRHRQITGSYAATAQPGYHCILQGCDLHLHLHDVSQETPTEQWVETHLPEMLAFFQQHPTSKAAILVYSVATARRLVTRLREYFIPHGITVGENTGLTNAEEKAQSFKQHILVGTSTVDVGIDFHINYLIFEAFDSGTFLQRFGRLGRHAEFPAYTAHALLPRFVHERLQEQIGSIHTMEREGFNTLVREVFPTEQQFKQYAQRWGAMQAAMVLMELQHAGGKGQDEHSAFSQALQEHYERLYGTSGKEPVMGKALKRCWAYSKKAPEILRELASFRGQSPLSCGVWDTDNHLKTYDLFFLLANTDFHVMDKAVFMQEVRQRGLEERDFEQQLVYLRIEKYIPERQQLVLGLAQDLGNTQQHKLHQLQICPGFFVDEPRHRDLGEINKALKKLRLPCIFSNMKRAELKGRLNLSMLFPINRLRDSTGYEYSLAFGQEALLLESILHFRTTKGDKAMML